MQGEFRHNRGTAGYDEHDGLPVFKRLLTRGSF
jgi:hypothetical protein